MSEILNVEDVCTFLKISKPTLYRHVRAGIVPGIKVGKNWKFAKEQIEKLFLASGKKPQAPAKKIKPAASKVIAKAKPKKAKR